MFQVACDQWLFECVVLSTSKFVQLLHSLGQTEPRYTAVLVCLPVGPNEYVLWY